MADPTENPADGTVNILTIALLIGALVGLVLTFLAFQATSLS